MQALLEAVDFEVAVCDCRTDAIFTETAGLDAQLAEQGEDGRMYASVALEFDDDKVFKFSGFARLMIEDVDAEVDGQALGLGIVDEGDAVEVVFNGGDNVAEGVACALGEEFFAVVVVDNGFYGGYFYTLLTRLPVVVLLLDF